MFALSETIAPTEPSTAVSPSPDDFSQFSVGQEYDGKVISAKKFGIFVNIEKGTDVLLPRSLLSPGTYDKLKKLVDDKSQEKVRVELVTVSAANRTLSAKYISDKFKSRPDLSSLNAKELESKVFNATITSAHEFGVFAEIEELGVEGLVPISKLPERTDKSTIQAQYKKGSKLMVKIDTINVDNKKLILSARTVDSRVDITKSIVSDTSPDKWIQGVVQSVANYGLFIRPAGMDTVGLLHQSRVPRELISTLKKISPITPGTNKSDIESLFQAGDILKVRIASTTADKSKLELSCLPVKATTDAEDDFNIIEDEDEAKEMERESRDSSKTDGKDSRGGRGGGGGNSNRSRGGSGNNQLASDSILESDTSGYNPLSVVVWWRGQPFDKVLGTIQDTSANQKDEELEVITESRDVVEGTWRRLFELDLREDEADSSAKALEMELKELEEEIGELNGLDEELGEDFGLGTKFYGKSMGASVAFSIPNEWKEKIEFFKEFDEKDKIKSAMLRGGKKSEVLELESVIRETESEIERNNASNRQRRGPSKEDGIVAAAEAAMTTEPVIHNPVATPAATEPIVPPTEAV